MKSFMGGFLRGILSFSVVLSASNARAAEETTADEATREARDRFREGVSLYDRANYEAATAKFKQAYALKRHPDVLLNVGWSCLRAGHHDEAREAFREYLRSARDASADKRAQAERGLEEISGGRPLETPVPMPAETTRTAADATTEAVPPQNPLRVDALLGFTSQNLGLSIAARVGKIAFSRLHMGDTFVYHVGHSVSAAAANGIAAESSYSAFVLGPEAGYDLDVQPFVVRPYVGLGLGTFSSIASVTGGPSVSASVTELVFWGGGTATYDLPGTSFTAGVDMRLAFVPTGTAVGAFASGGLRF